MNGPCTGIGGSWLGVTCSAIRVSDLTLNGAGLGGATIPAAIGDLIGLTALTLASTLRLGIS